VVAAAAGRHDRVMTSQSVAAMIISGMVLLVIGILGGGRFDVILLGAALLFGAGLFQTLDNRRAAR
jgi:hypothetical protein